MSSTGRFIAFDSDASNLTAGGNPARDIFVRDTTTRVATLVSADPLSDAGLASFSPDISANGRYVTFHSFAGFDSQDGNASPDIYVRDLQQNITTLVSRASGASGVLANNWSSHPVISADGRFVAFHSTASNLVPGDNNGQSDIFLRDLQTNTTTRVSIADNEDEGNGPTQSEIDISSDGRFIAFESAASNLVQLDDNNDYDVFVRDTVLNTTNAMSITNSGPNGGFGTGNQGSYFPSISNDGRYVAFHSFASDLALADNNGTVDIFLRDRQTGVTSLMSIGAAGSAQANGLSDHPSISGNGQYIVFRSFATNLSSGDNNSYPDIFKKDRIGGGISIVSSLPAGIANGGSDEPDISSDGSVTAFETDASNFVSTDNNGVRDIVLRGPGGIKGVSTMTNGGPAASVTVAPTTGDRSTSFQAAVTGTDPDGDPITYYQVSWGDGQQSYAQSPGHSYTQTGDFNVTAVVCDQFSQCSVPSSPTSVHVTFSNRAPVAVLTVAPNRGDVRTTFQAGMGGSYDPDQDSLSYSVDWGDGTVSPGVSPTHQYTYPGVYEVQGTVTDFYDGSASTVANVNVCVVDLGGQCPEPPPAVCDAAKCESLPPPAPDPCNVVNCDASPDPEASTVPEPLNDGNPELEDVQDLAAGVPEAPKHSFNRYLETVSPKQFYDAGHDLGVEVQLNTQPNKPAVVLDFGGQQKQNGHWGVGLTDADGFYSMNEVRESMEQFGMGFYYGTGSDTGAFLFMVMGTNNSTPEMNDSDMVQDAGDVWAGSVAKVNDWLVNHGPGDLGFGAQAGAVGGNDIEMEFGGPSAARSWTSAYTNGDGSGPAAYWDFGDCWECPPVSDSPHGAWDKEDVWYVSSGNYSIAPLPIIYANSGVTAAQWERMAEYAHDVKDDPNFIFAGTVTQHKACIQEDQPSECDGANMSAPKGWKKLWKALNQEDYVGHEAPNYVHQGSFKSTDFKHHL